MCVCVCVYLLRNVPSCLLLLVGAGDDGYNVYTIYRYISQIHMSDVCVHSRISSLCVCARVPFVYKPSVSTC